MRAGTLRHRVTIQEKPAVTRDSHGQEILGWSTLATVWARIEPISGRESVENKQEQATVSHRVTIRYRTGVRPTMRLLHLTREGDNQYLLIESIIEADERGRMLVLSCVEHIEE